MKNLNNLVTALLIFTSVLFVLPQDTFAADFLVNSTGNANDANVGDIICDTGLLNSEGLAECTLHAAIEEANANIGQDNIFFNIPVTDPGHIPSPPHFTINLSSSLLPNISDQVNIDATTQPEFTSTPIIELNGAGAVASVVLLGLDNSIIRGFLINNFADDGIVINGGMNNSIMDNWIGVEASGNSRSNQGDGISLVNASFSFIQGNVVSSNIGSGISLFGAQAQSNLIIDNLIGLHPDGVTPSGNSIDGIRFQDQPANNQIGSFGANDGNYIAYNQGRGVALEQDAGSDNSILGNSIFNNTNLGIDHSTDGVTANDPGDTDTGPNDLQNFPVLNSVSVLGNDVTVHGSLNSSAGTYRIEFFTNTQCDASGFGEGETLIGFTTIAADGSGNTIFAVSLSLSGQLGSQLITSTATESFGGGVFGSTSEFSECLGQIIDSDGDGIPDDQDPCPFDPDNDADGDGVCGDVDGCPNDPNKIDPGVCGCGTPDTDSDNDGTPDCNDGCQNDPNKTDPGLCGCGTPDTDSDNDGTPDCNDGCQNDPNKTDPGACGCGTPDTDTDNDGVPDCIDNCPEIPNPGQEDSNSNGVGDACEGGASGECDCDDPSAIHGSGFIFGTFRDDIICGSPGRDIIFGFFGDDCIDSGDGRDKVFSGFGDDVVRLGPGNDRAWGGFGNDDIDGEEGRDKISGGRGTDTCVGEKLFSCEQ